MPFTLELGSDAPDFSLIGTDGKKYSLDTYKDSEVLVVFFTCNHCPYVINSDELTRKTVEKFKPRGVSFVGINSNSSNAYEEDSYPNMVKRMQSHSFPWEYLHDPSQEAALKYGALRTPHFFVFDKERRLIYTGRAVDFPRDTSKVTTFDLERALEEHLSGKEVTNPLTNPIGCNVKWEGKDKHWMPPEACDLI